MAMMQNFFVVFKAFFFKSRDNWRAFLAIIRVVKENLFPGNDFEDQEKLFYEETFRP